MAAIDAPSLRLRAGAATRAADDGAQEMIRALAIVGLLAAAPAVAQDEDLRGEQRRLAAALAEQPADLELMFAYAVVSMRLEDYEPAIATLERMLIFNDDLPRVRLELAVAYYRLGVYDVARHYFESVRGENTPEVVETRIAAYLNEIDRRTAKDSLTGFFALGPVYNSNANFGSPNRLIRINAPGFPDVIEAGERPAPDWGLRLTAAASHSRDLGRANEDAWLTEAVYSGQRYRSEDAGDFDALRVATGPRLALDDESFGLKARPFAGAGLVRSGGDPLYVEGGVGADLTDTLDAEWTVFLSSTLDWREFGKEDGEFDGLYGAVFAGAVHALRRDAELRFSAFGRTDRAQESWTSSNEIGLRAAASRAFEVSGIEGFAWFERPWRASAFGQVSHRFFDGPRDDVDPDTTRREIDARVGARLLAPVSGDGAVALDVSLFERFSNLPNYDLQSFEVGVSYVRYF